MNNWLLLALPKKIEIILHCGRKPLHITGKSSTLSVNKFKLHFSSSPLILLPPLTNLRQKM
jgi:hypothetical protein